MAGLFALVLGALRIPILPVVLGFILGGLLEQNLAVLRATADGPGYLLERPIALALFALSFVILAARLWRHRRRSVAGRNASAASTREPGDIGA